LDWTPGGESIVFSATRPGRAGWASLWRVSASGGELEPLEVGEQGEYPTVSRQGARLSYATVAEKFDIWRVGGPSARGEERSPTRFISSTECDHVQDYSPDGQKIAFTSNRSGHYEVWVCDSDGSNPRQLTFLEDPHTFAGSWSPDGNQIAFFSPKEGSWDIYVMNVTGGFPRRLTTEASDEAVPRWSKDGDWIYFASNRTGRFELYKMPVEGGDAVQLTTNGGGVAFESTDGRFLYFAKSDPEGGPRGIWCMPIDGGEQVQVHDHGEYVLWELLEQGICYLNRYSDPPAIELFDFATGEVSLLAVLERQPAIWGFSVSPDGRWVLYDQEETESDIMLVENFR
jgi:Tol biopolymer transport system component